MPTSLHRYTLSVFRHRGRIASQSDDVAGAGLNLSISIGLYKREQVSLGRAAEIASISSPAFLDELGRRKIPINYDIDDLHAYLASLRDAH